MKLFKAFKKFPKTSQITKFQNKFPKSFQITPKLFNNSIKPSLLNVKISNRFYSELRGATSFNDLENLHPDLKKGIQAKGLDQMFHIQEQTWKALSEGRDLIGRAKTGSGKTMAFVLPILNRIKQKGLPAIPYRPYALVLAPTRELANQIGEEFQGLDPSLKVLTVAGGKSIIPQIDELKSGVHVIIGTPGRISDHLQRATLILDEADRVVLDEVDVMLDKGFADDVEHILSHMNPSKERQVMLFSATLPPWIQNVAARYLKNPVTVDLVGKGTSKIPTEVKHVAVELPEVEQAKVEVLADILTVYMKNKALIFVNTKAEADKLAEANLRQPSAVLHGDITQFKRDLTLKGFKEGRYSVLIATDVASRGLDIPFVDTVVHYDIPARGEDYIHRSGRCGRAGKTGTSILCHFKREGVVVHTISKEAGVQFTKTAHPNTDQIWKAAPQRVVSILDTVKDETAELFKEAATQLYEEKGIDAIAKALVIISGYRDYKPRSLLTFTEGYTTTLVSQPNRSSSSYMRVTEVLEWLQSLGLPQKTDKGICITESGSVILDIPSEIIEQLVEKSAENPKYKLEVVQKLPPIRTRYSSSDNTGGSRNRYNLSGRYGNNNEEGGYERRGSYGNRGGFGNRNNDRGGFGNRNNERGGYGNRGGYDKNDRNERYGNKGRERSSSFNQDDSDFEEKSYKRNDFKNKKIGNDDLENLFSSF